MIHRHPAKGAQSVIEADNDGVVSSQVGAIPKGLTGATTVYQGMSHLVFKKKKKP